MRIWTTPAFPHGRERREVSQYSRRRFIGSGEARSRRTRRVESGSTCGQSASEERYRREFLSGEQFRRFDIYRRTRLTDLLELPGAGRVVGGLF